MRSRPLVPLGLAAAAFALALAQRPGETITDTKIDLLVDPGGFLADVASTWTPSGSLGHVWGGQYAGYLFPMGPFYALGDAAGLAPWLVQRLWLGALLALAAWGTVRLLDALLTPSRGVAHVIAGALIVINPYVTVFANRTSVTLLGYAALPWLLLATHRGLRDARRWWWPAAFALLVAATGPGVNAAVTGFALLGPALLLAYEPLLGEASWRDAGRFIVRAGAATLAVSLWWIVPALTQARLGNDFLAFTEQPGTIWGTTSVTESLRLMGFWLSYVGLGKGAAVPYFDDSPTLLFEPAVVVAGLLVPALALAGFAWTRRWRHGPFFLALLLLGVLVMAAGFPEGTPLRRGLNFVYNHVAVLQFLRTTYKAAPLAALGLAVLAGAAAAEAWRRLEARLARRGAPLAVAAAACVAVVALLAAASWPLASGRAVDAQLAWDRIPPAWTATARDLDRDLPAGGRALVLPGQLFAFYRWGGTVDAVLPALTDRPVAARFIVPFADLHAIDAHWTVDALVGQRRLLPGQLPPLLSLLGARAVVSGSDDDQRRSFAPPPGEAATALAQQGLARPDRAYGPVTRHPRAPGEPAGPVALPQVRRYDLPPGRAIVRVEPLAPGVIVDGSAEALAGLAALGALPADRPLHYAGDRSAAELRREAAAGAEIVISDSNRRRVFVPSRLEQNAGPTLAADEPFSTDAAVLDPFPGRGAAGQTVALYDGIAGVVAPSSPGYAQFPEHRPFAALDRSRATAWLADPSLDVTRRWIEVRFSAPRDIAEIELVPYGDRRARVTAVRIGGRRYPVHAGVNRLRVGLRAVGSLRVYIAGVRRPGGDYDGAGGIAELRIRGVRAAEWLRPPVLATRALRSRDLASSPVSFLFARTTGDAPWSRGPDRGAFQDKQSIDRERIEVVGRGDAEAAIARHFTSPVGRGFAIGGFASVDPAADDPTVDRLAGTRTAGRFDSSGRHNGRPGFRASAAFDGSPGRGWVGTLGAGPRAFLAWRLPAPVTVRTLRLEPPALPVARPVRVRLRWGGGETGALAVGRNGEVRLPRPARSATFRLEVLAARGGTTTGAVGIGEVRGVPGARSVPAAPASRIIAPCGAVAASANGRRVALRALGSVADLDAGRPLRARGCGDQLALRAGANRLRGERGPLRLDLVRLRAPAPRRAAAVAPAGRVLDPGRAGRGRHDGVRVALAAPAWLVLGESYSPGWRAYCDEVSLGRPVAIDGFANGWRAPRDCRAVRFAFAPNRTAVWAYLFSGLAALVLIGVLGLGLRRRRTATAPAPAARSLPAPDRPARWPLRRAAAAGLAAGAALGFVFALRAGVVIAPAVALILWRGVGARALVLAAGALLGVVVPVLYLVLAPEDRGGFNFNYAADLIAAHWVGVAALVLVIVALARTLATARAGH